MKTRWDQIKAAYMKNKNSSFININSISGLIFISNQMLNFSNPWASFYAAQSEILRSEVE